MFKGGDLPEFSWWPVVGLLAAVAVAGYVVITGLVSLVSNHVSIVVK